MKKIDFIKVNLVLLNKSFVSISIILMFLVFGMLLLIPSSYSWATLCNDSDIAKYNYLLTFHAHTPENSQPQNHKIYLAGSQDGVSWTLIENFEPISGSVPELVYYNNAVYIFHTGKKHAAKLNECLEVIEENSVTLNSLTDTGGYVDPSLIVSDQDLYLFYLPGIIGQDPASCLSYPCVKTIHSATANDSALTSFTQYPGDRLSVALNSGGMSDPEIVKRSDGTYLLYVSSGSNVWLFTSSTLNGKYVSPDGDKNRVISNNSGGVPGAVAVENDVWLYVPKNINGREVIRRAVITNGVEPADDADFITVIDHTISADFSDTTSVSSPSIIKSPYIIENIVLNSYAVLTDSAAPFQIPSSIGYVEVKGSTGGNIIKIEPDANVIFKNANAPNVIVFQQESAEFIVYSSGNTVYFADADSKILDNTTLELEAEKIPQTLYFTDGSITLSTEGENIILGENNITEQNSVISNIDRTKFFIEPIINEQPKSITEYLVLTDKSPIFSIDYGTYAKVFGSAGKNTIYVKSGGKITCENFIGSNEISVESAIADFTVYRSGATLYLTGKNGTYIRIPATLTPQTFKFSDEVITLSIFNNKMMLGNNEITTNEMPLIK